MRVGKGELGGGGCQLVAEHLIRRAFFASFFCEWKKEENFPRIAKYPFKRKPDTDQ